MSINKKLQVFVSSTYEDMKEERQAAVEAILEAGHIPAGMELFAAGNAEQLKIIQRWIDSSDVYMLILGGRYGSIEPTSNRSYIECEFDYAVSVGKPIFSLVMSDRLLDSKVRRLGTAAIEKFYTERQSEFCRKVMSRLCAIFSSVEELQKEVIKSLIDIQREESLVGWVRGNDDSVAGVGQVQHYFYPFLDPMKTKVGKPIRCPKSMNSWNPYILCAKFKASESSRFVYGPYRTLPVVGKYVANFRIRADIHEAGTVVAPILMLDVYDYYGGRLTYASREVRQDEIAGSFKTISLEFHYPTTHSRLEYRVGYIAAPNRIVDIYLDQIIVEKH